MILELSATEIIASVVKKKYSSNRKTKDSAIIRIQKIQRIAHQLEIEIPSLLTYCDMMAIEECKYEFGDCVTIDASSIRISGVKKLESRISRYLPENNIYIKIAEKI